MLGLVALTLCCGLTGLARAADSTPASARDLPRRLIAIDNLCGWPNTTRLPDGTLIATVYNQPNHGFHEGDAECWASTDGGYLWKYRGTPTKHEPFTNRMNVGAGLNKKGELVVLCSGWDDIRPTRNEKSRPLPLTTSISGDAGRTWQILSNAPAKDDPSLSNLVPFGDICIAENGDLVAGLYSFDPDFNARKNGSRSLRGNVYAARSKDDGKTWTEINPVVKGTHVEAALIHLGKGQWLSASRRFGFIDLDIHASSDDARTWTHVTTLGIPAVSAAHLLKMSDGRILLTYGNRSPDNYGIDSRISPDGGKTWGPPQRLINLDARDNGYPEATEMEGGRIMIAYYTSGITQHRRYHVGIVNVFMDEFVDKK